jgi:ribonuclease HI
MGRLLLMRHAESEGNHARIFTATPDVPLTARGRAQAEAAAEWIGARHRPARVVTSPYVRAVQTATIVGDVLGVPLELEPDLRERDYGELAGKPYSSPRQGYDPARRWEWRPPGGETLVEVQVRVGSAVDRLMAESPEDDVVVVSHGAVMMALWRHVTGAWEGAQVVRNTAILVVEHGSKVHSVKLVYEPDS